MSRQEFEGIVEPRLHGAIAIRVPFEPSTVWGQRDRYYVTGSIDGRSLRGRLTGKADASYLQLGPAWNCDRFVGGDRVSVRLEPEGPQVGTVAADVGEALVAEPVARRHFESLATFYRKGYIRWIEGAKRPETRAKRIQEAVAALKAGRPER